MGVSLTVASNSVSSRMNSYWSRALKLSAGSHSSLTRPLRMSKPPVRSPSPVPLRPLNLVGTGGRPMGP